MSAGAKHLKLSAKRRALLKLLVQQDEEGNSSSIPSRDGQKPLQDDVSDPPLSFAQERLWFLDQFESNLAIYNIPFTIGLPNPLNQRAVERAVNEIVRRHDALRTAFHMVGEHPVQIVAPHSPFELPTVDLSHRSSADRDAAVAGMVAAERVHKFDLHGPLFRVMLVRLAESDHILLVNVHHIVFDGWSIGVFMREFSALYDASAANRRHSLAELPIQYVDFARRQREELSGDALQSLLAFWRKKLSGAPAVIELPTDRPRPKHQTFHGETQLFLVPRSLAQSLANLSRTSGATLFMTLLVAFKVLLNRYTGQTDLVVGTPIANRNRADIEPLIGFFVNTLVLRTDVSDNPSIRELLRRVRDVTLEAYANQDLPFERLVQELQPDRNLSHSPIFQVLFALQNASAAPAAASAYSNANEPTVVEGTAKFDLSLFLAETENGLAGEFEYNTALFDRSTATRFVRHFQRVLAAIAEDPNQRLSNVSLLDEQEIRRQVQRWAGPEVSYPNICVHRLFEAQARRTPEAPAVIFNARQMSFRELDQQANRLAFRLHKLGVVPDVPVGVLLHRSFEATTAILGILKAGGAYVPFDPSYPESRLAFMIADAGIGIMITSRKWLDHPLLRDLVTLVAEEGAADEEPTQQESQYPAEPDNLAYVIYTSGSTGRPKGVAMTHRPLVNLIQWQTGSDEFTSGTRTLQFAPLSFDVSFQEMFSTWSSGGALVLVDEITRGDFQALARYLDANDVNRLYLPPVALAHLAESADTVQIFPRSISKITCAGERLTVSTGTADFLGQIGAGLRNQYGPTETHVVTEFALTGAASNWPALPPIGRPIDNVRLYILDEELRPVPDGIRGELFVGGAAVARGYLKRPLLTAERFLPDPFGPSGARMYRTGDFVRSRPDGNLVFLGRVDGEVKIRGFRIDLGEVEAVLREHEDVAQAAVVVREDASGLASLGAYVALKMGRQFVPSELRQFLSRMLPEHFIPSSFWRLGALPVSPNGKIDRKALPILDSSTRGEGGFVAPRSDLEERIARIWAGVLSLDRVGAQDNFFDLGGHSLLATQVISRLRQQFDVNLPLRIMFEPSLTVVELARAVVIDEVERAGIDETAHLIRDIEQLTEGELASELDADG